MLHGSVQRLQPKGPTFCDGNHNRQLTSDGIMIGRTGSWASLTPAGFSGYKNHPHHSKSFRVTVTASHLPGDLYRSQFTHFKGNSPLRRVSIITNPVR